MPTYTAHYRSLAASDEHISGSFEFESEARAGTKLNASDARVCMLETFGNKAISWSIHKIERKAGKSAQIDGQFELDFREPHKKVRVRRKYL